MPTFFKWAPLALVMTALSTTAYAENLLGLYNSALDNNPTLKRRQFEVTQAEAQKDIALSRLLPQVSVDVTRSPQITYSDTNTGLTQRYAGLRRSVQLRQALFDLSSWYRMKSERSHVLQTGEGVDTARMMMGGDLVERYLDALLAEDELARIEAEKQAVDAQVKRLRKMRELQMATVTDLYETEAYLQTLETQAIDAGAARAIALEKLQEICGAPVEHVAGLDHDGLPTEARSMAQWVDEAEARNPLLLGLRHAVEAAQNMVSSGRAQHAPVVTLLATKLYSDQGYDNRLQPPYSVGSVSLQLSLPLYEGGRVNATVSEAMARRDIAEQQYEESRREIVRQIRSDYLHAAASRVRVESTNREVQAQKQLVEAQEKRHRLGVTTIVDLLDARRRLLKAQAEQSAARYDLIRDMTALRVHAGQFDGNAMAEISGWFSGAGAATGG